MTSAQSLPERDKFLMERLDRPIRFAFESMGMTPMSGPADRYGVFEWVASVDDFARFIPSGLDTSDTKLNAAIAAWSEGETAATVYGPTIQVTIAARTRTTLARWAFAPRPLPGFATDDAGGQLSDVLLGALQSDRTLAVIWSALSPENAPSDMQVLPLIPEEPLRILGDDGRILGDDGF